MRRLFIQLFILALAIKAQAGVPLPQPLGVESRLISEAKTIVPGQTFTVALSLKHEEGFHTYWINPGIVGIATALDWTLPEGFKAGEIQWQVPERVVMVIYNAHGYNSDALLLVDITAPDTLPEGPVTMKAGGAWMACAKKRCCNVGYKQLEVTVNTGEKVEWDEEAREQIQQARARIPKPIPGWKYTASRSGNEITLKVKNERGTKLKIPKEMYFYSERNHIDTLVEQDIKANEDELIVVLPINEVSRDKDIHGIKGLFYYPGGWPGSKGQEYMPVSVDWK